MQNRPRQRSLTPSIIDRRKYNPRTGDRNQRGEAFEGDCLSSWPRQPAERPEQHNNKDHDNYGQG
jgi:hypothetical protein